MGSSSHTRSLCLSINSKLRSDEHLFLLRPLLAHFKFTLARVWIYRDSNNYESGSATTATYGLVVKGNIFKYSRR